MSDRRGNTTYWVLVFGSQELDDSEVMDRWVSSLKALMRVLWQPQHAAPSGTISSRRQQFFRSLLEYEPTSLEEDFKHICRAWQQVSNADWAWLWLYNCNSDQFELTAFAARDPQDEEQRRVVPKRRTAPGKNSLAMYCLLTRQPIFVDNPSQWSGEHEGHAYEVATREDLNTFGSVALECIPLLTAAPKYSNGEVHTPGAVGLHSRDVGPRVAHTPEVLLHMGCLTASAIRNSQMTEQRAILVKLNRLAQSYLGQPARKPAMMRAEYLRSLISLIKEHIHVRGVSVFYRKPFANAVECIATTGLCNSKGAPISDDELRRVVYKAYEGLVGCCFASATPIIVQRPKDDQRYDGRFLPHRDVSIQEGALDPISLRAYPINPCGTGFQPVRTRVANPCHTFWDRLLATLSFDVLHVDSICSVKRSDTMIREEASLATIPRNPPQWNPSKLFVDK